MRRQTRSHSTLLNLGRHLLGIGLCLGICTIAQAAGYPGELDAQTLNPIAQYMNAAPDITCGKQPGQRPASLNIRGADVATLWRSAYHMIFPGLSLADNSKVGRAVMIPHKGPAWGIRINKRTALMTVQTKW
jgi:hypothetical protein